MMANETPSYTEADLVRSMEALAGPGQPAQQQQQAADAARNTGTSSQKQPVVRDEIDVIFNRLMALEAFRKLHPSLIRNLCSYAFIERIEKGVLVFRQGDDAINWYALLEGSVDVKVTPGAGQQQQATAPPDDQRTQAMEQDGVTLCTLGIGTTFGASVMPGKLHNVSVVTNEECTLLRVRRADFQEIFRSRAPSADQQQQPVQRRRSHGLHEQAAPASDPGALGALFYPFAPAAKGVLPAADAALQRPAAPMPAGPASRRRSSLASELAACEHQRRQSVAASRQQPANCDTLARLRNQDELAGGELRATEAPGNHRNQPVGVQQVPRPDERRNSNNLSNDNNSASHHHHEHNIQPCDPRDNDDGDVDDGQMGATEDEEVNLESLSANELPSQLMRASWVLQTLLLASRPHQQLIRDRQVPAALLRAAPPSSLGPAGGGAQLAKVSPKSMITPIRHHLNKHLVSMGSSSQLLAAGGQPTGSSWSLANASVGAGSNSNASQTAKSAGRKVANYVASSFMRSSSKQQQQLQEANDRYQPAGDGFDQTSAWPGQQEGAGGQKQPQPQRQQQDEELVPLEDSMVGSELVDWLVGLGQGEQGGGAGVGAGRFLTSRLQAVSMWQALLERGLLVRHPASLVGQRKSDGGGGGGGGQAWRRSAAQFCDEPHAYYKFAFEQRGQPRRPAQDQSAPTRASPSPAKHKGAPSEQELELAKESLWWSLKLLSKLAPDACFRLILSKRPHERTAEEVDMVFEELQHLKALSHLTISVKKQLAACVHGEHHAKQNTIVFNQGDVGHSWYIILRGSVNVVIVGKGVVCTLHDGDDFGKLALVNDAPRAATIVTSESQCYFLRVDKHDFNTILRDVEANTVRLKEHGKEVLILQKVAVKEATAPAAGQQDAAINHEPASVGPWAAPESQQHPQQQQSAGSQAQLQQHQQQAQAVPANSQQIGSTTNQQATQQASALKYMVMAGTAEKMLEHLLETRIDGQTQTAPLSLNRHALHQHDQVASFLQCQGDNFLEDFILTHKIFMPTGNLCQELLRQYQWAASGPKQQQQQQQQQHKPLISGQPAAAPDGQAQLTNNLDDEYLVAKKRRVIKFVRFWMLINREHFFQQHQIQSFVMALHQKVKRDAQRFTSLQAELAAISRIYEFQLEENLETRQRGCQRWIEDVYGNMLPIRRHSGTWQAAAGCLASEASEQFLSSLHQRRFEHKLSTIQAHDELVFRVYCTDHTFTTLKCRLDEQAGHMKQLAARNLKLEDKELILVHVKSNGERIIYNDLETNICTCLSVNGRLFVCPLDHIDAIAPLPEQDPFQEVYASGGLQQWHSGGGGGGELAASGQNLTASAEQQLANQENAASSLTSHLLTQTPTSYQDIKLQMSLSVNKLEEFSSRDIAYCLSQLAWALLKNMHEFELVYTVFGRHNFKQVTANLNVFLRHFNEIQYWVVTQICLSSSLSKRVQILRKFIKIAAHCKELQNLNAFFAIIMGLSNMAVARLTQTWERLPNKLKRTFSQFESQIDPSRNHRRYRIAISKLEPPIIPFMPLLLKDMTFAHEGNKTHLENGLINFEKMQMIAQTLRTVRRCESRPMKLDVASVCKFKSSIRSIELFFRDLKIIDNQRTLTQMSHQLEHRKA